MRHAGIWGAGVALVAGAVLWSAVWAQEAKPDRGPAERQTAFLKDLQAGRVKQGYDELLKGSHVPAEGVQELITATKRGFELYGDAAEYEDLGIVRQDKHVAIGMGILCCERMPLFFYVVWYRPTEAAPWRVTNTWFNDKGQEYMDRRR